MGLLGLRINFRKYIHIFILMNLHFLLFETSTYKNETPEYIKYIDIYTCNTSSNQSNHYIQHYILSFVILLHNETRPIKSGYSS